MQDRFITILIYHELKGTVHCLQSRLSLFVYIRNNVCAIYVHRNRIQNYSEPCIAMSSFAWCFAQIPARIALPVINAFAISARHSLLQASVTSTGESHNFLGVQ